MHNCIMCVTDRMNMMLYAFQNGITKGVFCYLYAQKHQNMLTTQVWTNICSLGDDTTKINTLLKLYINSETVYIISIYVTLHHIVPKG